MYFNTFYGDHYAGDFLFRRGISNHIPHSVVSRPVSCGEDVQVQAVKLHLQGLELLVYNVYRKQRADLDLGELLTLAATSSVLVGGDFNAHHPLLGSRSRTNEAGRHIASLLDDIEGIKLLNSGEPTHLQGNSLDLTFVTSILADGATWHPHPTLTSDHFAIKISLNLPPPPRQEEKPRWCFSKADWSTFRREVARWWKGYSPPADSDSFDSDLANALINAAKTSIPQVCTNRPLFKNWWFYSPRMKEINHRVNRARKLFRRHRTEGNLASLRQVVHHARLVAREEREASSWSGVKVSTNIPLSLSSGLASEGQQEVSQAVHLLTRTERRKRNA